MRLQEIHLSADTGELSGAGRLGIFLSHQIQLDTTVDTDDIFISPMRYGEWT